MRSESLIIADPSDSRRGGAADGVYLSLI